MKHIATYEIHDTFRITGRGIVFTGRILNGEFLTGDYIKFEFDGQILERKINGVEMGRKIIDGKHIIGVLIESPHEKEMENLKNWNPNLAIGEIYTNQEPSP